MVSFVCTPYNELFTTEYNLLLCFDLIEVRERHSTAWSLRICCKDIPLDCTFDYLREIRRHTERH